MDEREELGVMTAGQVAASLGINRRTVWRIATEHGIGQKVGPRLRLFTPEDADRIRGLTHWKRGRPARSRPPDRPEGPR